MTKQIAEDYHFSMSLGKGLFSELLGAALPMKLTGGSFNLTENLRQAARQLQVKEKVAGLLTGPENEALVRVKDRAADVWKNRREQVYEVVDKIVKVEGDWKVELDQDGSDFKYGDQRIGAEAYFKLVASGKATLLANNLEVPFTIEKRVGAEVNLAEIRYDEGTRQITGELKDIGVDLGDNIILKIANDIVGKVLEQQSYRFNPVPVLKKDQLDELVGGAGTALKLKMEVTDVFLDINEEYITLKVKFGFTQLQLAEKAKLIVGSRTGRPRRMSRHLESG